MAIPELSPHLEAEAVQHKLLFFNFGEHADYPMLLETMESRIVEFAAMHPTGTIYYFIECSDLPEHRAALLEQEQSPLISPREAYISAALNSPWIREDDKVNKKILFEEKMREEPLHSNFSMLDRLHAIMPARIRFVFEAQTESDEQFLKAMCFELRYTQYYHAFLDAFNEGTVEEILDAYKQFIHHYSIHFSLRQKGIARQLQVLLHTPHTAGIFVRIGPAHSSVAKTFENYGYKPEITIDENVAHTIQLADGMVGMLQRLETEEIIPDTDWLHAAFIDRTQDICLEQHLLKVAPQNAMIISTRIILRLIEEEGLMDTNALRGFLKHPNRNKYMTETIAKYL